MAKDSKAKKKAFQDGFKKVEPVTTDDNDELVMPEGVEVITVTEEGEYFCQFASQKGFRDCTYLREINTHLRDKAFLDVDDRVAIPEKRPQAKTGSSETTIEGVRVDYPPATIRFLGINEDVGDRDIDSLERVGISNYVTNKAQITPDKKGLVSGKEHKFYKKQGADDKGKMDDEEKETHADPDHFRIEVHDVSAKKGKFKKTGKVKIEIQVLQPMYERDNGDDGSVIVRNMEFVQPSVDPTEKPPKGFKIPEDGGDEKTKRKLELECKQGKDNNGKRTNYFRSKYMRVVTEKEDFIKHQTLFVGDYYCDGVTTDEDEKRYTEILEQEILVRYKPLMCKSGKCRAIKRAKVGELKKEVRLAVHIFNDAASFADIRRCIYGQVRRTYAQVGIRPHLKLMRTLSASDNLIRIGTIEKALCKNATGERDENGTASSVTVEIPPHDLFNVPLAAGMKAAEVKDEIVRRLRALGLHPTDFKHVQKAAIPDDCELSWEILVYTDDKHEAPATVLSASSNDQAMSVKGAALTDDDLNNMSWKNHGTKMRTLKSLCKTDWFDIVVIPHFDRGGGNEDLLLGVATRMNHPESFPPILVVIGAAVKEDPHDKRNTVAHEMGHVLMHCGHAKDKVNNDQLMIDGALTDGIDAGDMAGRRHIMGKPLKMKVTIVDQNVPSPRTEIEEFTDDEVADDHAWGTMATRCHNYVTGEPFGDESARTPTTEW